MKRTVRFVNHRHIRPYGFTLIELLIVIAIIGVLMSIATVNFIVVRQRSRDAQRKTDLIQIQSALEFYRTDSGIYPDTTQFSAAQCGQPFMNGTAVYMKKIPCDPLTKTAYQYIPDSTGTTYTLYACLENTGDTDKATYPGSGTECDSNAYFAVTNP